MTQRLADPETFTIRLKEVMEEQQLKPKDLAERTGLSVDTIRQYTAPYGRVPGKENMKKLATALDISEEWLKGNTFFKTKDEEKANDLYLRHKEVFDRSQRFNLYVQALELLGYDVMPLVEAAEEHENGLAKILYDIDKYIDLNGNRYLNRKEGEDNGTDNQYE